MYQIKLLLSLILLFFESMYFRIEFIPPQESACSFRERGVEKWQRHLQEWNNATKGDISILSKKIKKEETHIDIKQCSCNKTGTTQKKIISNFSLWYLRIFIQRMRLRGSHSLCPHSHFELVRGYIYNSFGYGSLWFCHVTRSSEIVK